MSESTISAAEDLRNLPIPMELEPRTNLPGEDRYLLLAAHNWPVAAAETLQS